MKRNPSPRADLDAIADFCRANPAFPPWDERMVRRICLDLVSSEALLFDLHDDQGRALVAALLDRVENRSGDACLEVLGLRTTGSLDGSYETLLDLIWKALPAGKNGILISHHERHPLPSSFFAAWGYRPFYESFDMICEKPAANEPGLPEGYAWARLSADDMAEHHAVLTRAFKENFDTNIPPIEELARSFAKKLEPIWILRQAGREIGFVSPYQKLEAREHGEISVLGVLPEHRGRGLGRSLVLKGCQELASRGCKSIELSVAAANASALGLYKQCGFHVVDRWTRMRRAR